MAIAWKNREETAFELAILEQVGRRRIKRAGKTRLLKIKSWRWHMNGHLESLFSSPRAKEFAIVT
jgi:hypothetical protein